jgi:hypothetical protein
MLLKITDLSNIMVYQRKNKYPGLAERFRQQTHNLCKTGSTPVPWTILHIRLTYTVQERQEREKVERSKGNNKGVSVTFLH